jgi:hypothetical protein
MNVQYTVTKHHIITKASYRIAGRAVPCRVASLHVWFSGYPIHPSIHTSHQSSIKATKFIKSHQYRIYHLISHHLTHNIIMYAASSWFCPCLVSCARVPLFCYFLSAYRIVIRNQPPPCQNNTKLNGVWSHHIILHIHTHYASSLPYAPLAGCVLVLVLVLVCCLFFQYHPILINASETSSRVSSSVSSSPSHQHHITSCALCLVPRASPLCSSCVCVIVMIRVTLTISFSAQKNPKHVKQ